MVDLNEAARQQLPTQRMNGGDPLGISEIRDVGAEASMSPVCYEDFGRNSSESEPFYAESTALYSALRQESADDCDLLSFGTRSGLATHGTHSMDYQLRSTFF
jgi:hypothetical protein